MADVPQLPNDIIDRIITMARKQEFQPVLDELMEYHRNDPKEWVEYETSGYVQKEIKPSFEHSMRQTMKPWWKYRVTCLAAKMNHDIHYDYFCKYTYDYWHNFDSDSDSDSSSSSSDSDSVN